jgi:hypothetical protein
MGWKILGMMIGSRLEFRKLASNSTFIRIFVFVSMMVVPLAYLAPGVLQETAILNFKSSNGPSDIFGLYRWSQIFEWGITPLGFSNFTNYPKGEILFTLETFSQVFQLILIKIFSLVFEPAQAVNLLTFMNWTLIGLSIYALSLKISLPKSLSLVCGFYCQLQPSVIFSSLSLPSLIYIYIPIFGIVYFLTPEETKYKNTLTSYTLFFLTALVDIYLYYFSILIFSILLLTRINTSRNFRLNIFSSLKGFCAVLPFIPIVILFFIKNNFETAVGGRQLSAASKELIDMNGINYLDYFRPIPGGIRDNLNCRLICNSTDYFYGTIGIIFISFAPILFTYIFIKYQYQNPIKILTIITVALFLLGSKTFIPFGPFTIPNYFSELRHIFIGALYFDRTSIFIACFTTIIFFYFLQTCILMKTSLRKLCFPLVSCLLFINFLDFRSPLLQINSRLQFSYEPLKLYLQSDNSSGILFLPSSFFGRNWLEQVYFGLPMANSLLTPFATEGLLEVNEVGEKCNLINDGISHIATVKEVNRFYDLPPFFENDIRNPLKISKFIPGYESSFAKMEIYKPICTER